MNVLFKEPGAVVLAKEDIVVAGKVEGFMETSESRSFGSRFHAGIKLPGTLGLIQGFGETKEEALLNAIEIGRRDAHRALEEIDLFEFRLNS